MTIDIPAQTLTAKRDRIRKTLFVVNSNAVESATREQLNKYREVHLRYLEALDENNILIGAGPILENNMGNYRGSGLIIIKADSLSDAEGIAKTDPYHIQNIRQYHIVPWLLSEGKLLSELCT